MVYIWLMNRGRKWFSWHTISSFGVGAHQTSFGHVDAWPLMTDGRPSNNLQITQGAQCLHAYWYLSRIYTYNFQLHTYLWEVRGVFERVPAARRCERGDIRKSLGSIAHYARYAPRSYFCHRTKVRLFILMFQSTTLRVFVTKKLTENLKNSSLSTEKIKQCALAYVSYVTAVDKLFILFIEGTNMF